MGKSGRYFRLVIRRAEATSRESLLSAPAKPFLVVTEAANFPDVTTQLSCLSLSLQPLRGPPPDWSARFPGRDRPLVKSFSSSPTLSTPAVSSPLFCSCLPEGPPVSSSLSYPVFTLFFPLKSDFISSIHHI